MATDSKDKKQAFLKALEKTLNNVSQACTATGIPRSTVYNWLKTDKEFSETVTENNEVVLDFVEAKLFQQIQDGNVTAIIFFLKTRGRKRGYVERQEITTGDEKVVIQVHGNL